VDGRGGVPTLPRLFSSVLIVRKKSIPSSLAVQLFFRTITVAKGGMMHTNSLVGDVIVGGLLDWQYDLFGTDMFWVAKAKELQRMAEIGFATFHEDMEPIREMARTGRPNPAILGKPGTLTVAFFLAALSIENLLKALLVKQQPDVVKGGRLNGKVVTSHDLTRLASEVGIVLTDDEQDFCELGSLAITSFGRYQFGKNNSVSPSFVTVKGTAGGVYTSLFERLVREINPALI